MYPSKRRLPCCHLAEETEEPEQGTFVRMYEDGAGGDLKERESKPGQKCGRGGRMKSLS